MDTRFAPHPRRRSVRRALRLRCQAVRERDFRLVGDFGLDLSPDGMLLATNERMLTGEDVIVSFQIPTTREWFDAEATVARVVHGRRRGDARRAVGLSFHRVSDPNARAALESVLQRVPPVLPR